MMLVGSANMDLVIRAPRFPEPGETLTGSTFQTFPGGKGANQACAAAKLGSRVKLVAKLGSDAFGDSLMGSLTECGVICSSIYRDTDVSTGVALITVDDSGQNTIVVSPGTNALLSAEEVDQAFGGSPGKVVLSQLEIPLETVIAAAQNAAESVFILNPAPARQLPDDLVKLVDVITPNETEAHSLTGILPTDHASCQAAAEALLSRGAKHIIITLGGRGCYYAGPNGHRHFPAFPVQPIDTTAAGDAFSGALAMGLARGWSMESAIQFAAVAAALSTTKMGAASSMPTFSEVEAALRV